MKPRASLIFILALLFGFASLGTLWQFIEKQPLSILNTALWLLLIVFLWVCLVDYFISRNRKPLKIKRILEKNIILGRETTVRLQITATDPAIRQSVPITIGDCLPPDWTTDTPEIHTELLPMSQYGVEIEYTAIAHHRGDTQFSGIDYSLPSRLGLWQMIFRQPESQTQNIKVLPDFADIYGNDLMSFQRWLAMVGVKKSRRRGEGQDFFQLRDFMDGDNIRHIDWKATARTQKPIVRQFQDEKDRQIVFLLDCSREMQIMADGKNILDHALTALLLLAYTATHHGDAVGLMTCNANEDRFIPPAKGISQISHLINQIYDIEPTKQAFDLETACERLLSQQKRRAWVIVLTTLDSDLDRENIAILHRIQRHFPLLTVSLRQPVINEITHQTLNTTDDAAHYIGAMMREQDELTAIKQLIAADIPCLATYPKQLTAELINHYLNMKKNGHW